MNGLVAPFAIITFSNGRTIAEQLSREAGGQGVPLNSIPWKMKHAAARIVVFGTDGSAKVVKDRWATQRTILEGIAEKVEPKLEVPSSICYKYRQGDFVTVMKLENDHREGVEHWMTEFYGRTGIVASSVWNGLGIFYRLTFLEDGGVSQPDRFFREDRLQNSQETVQKQITAEEWIRVAKEGQEFAKKGLVDSPTMDRYLEKVREKLGPPKAIPEEPKEPAPQRDEHARMTDFFFRSKG